MRPRHVFFSVLAWILLILLLACPRLQAQAQPPTSQEKLPNIRSLILILAIPDVSKQITAAEFASLREEFPQLPPNDLESILREVDEKDLQELINLLTPIYDKCLTDEDLTEALKFYNSPTGKRLAQTMPQIQEESSRIVATWRKDRIQKMVDERGGLFSAVASGDIGRAKYLLSKGADVNERNSLGVTPLMAACYKGTIDMAKLFLESGADINATTPKGLTPLMGAVQAGHRELVKFLLSKGADANMKEELGLNAYQLATVREQHDMMTLLKDKTADKRSVITVFTVSSLGKSKDCVSVMSLPSEHSKQLTCLKLDQEVRPIPGAPETNGWTLIQYPIIGWIPSRSFEKKVVIMEQPRKPKEKSRESIQVKVPSDEPSLLVQRSTAKETQGVDIPTTPVNQPRIWWRHN